PELLGVADEFIPFLPDDRLCVRDPLVTTGREKTRYARRILADPIGIGGDRGQIAVAAEALRDALHALRHVAHKIHSIFRDTGRALMRHTGGNKKDRRSADDDKTK